MRRYLLSIVFSLGFAAISLFVYVFGDGGVREYRRLLRYRDALEQNVERLEETYAELLQLFYSLKTDPEAVRLAARDLGYYRPDEYVILLPGLEPEKRAYHVGSLVQLPQKERRKAGVSEGLLAVPLLLLICALLLQVWKPRRR